MARPRASREAAERGFWARIDQTAGPEGCWPWTARGRGGSHLGYGRLGWREGDDLRNRDAHVVAYRLEKGCFPEPGLVVRHTCDNTLCCNPAHLETGTHLENSRDMVARDRSLRGERHHLHRLKEEQVRAIFHRYKAGETQLALAEEFGVSKACVQFLTSGRTWKHLELAA